VAAVIVLLALLEGELMTGGVSQRLSRRIRDRLDVDGIERDLRQSISDLNHRLRYALGEYDEPPQPMAVPE
jgi:hypothetical protein